MRRVCGWRGVLTGLLTIMCVLVAGRADAQVGSERYSAFIMDAASGNVLLAVNPDEPRYPASLTKMMTLYMVFEALRDRRVRLDQPVPVSATAAEMMPSKLGLLPGARFSVEQAILGLVTKSANDAAAAMGEMLGGDETRFSQMMTLRARALGMTRTTFRNASGLPDPDQVSTARDLATLARHLIQDYPVEYRYFSVPSFVFRGRTIWNHDRMLQSYPGADGIKTGFIEASGHNLVTSARRGDVRLIGVVLGAAGNAERDAHMAALLDRGFENLGVPVAPRGPVPGGALGGFIAAAEAAPATPPVSQLRLIPTRLDTSRGRPMRSPWTIQVGAFPTERAARQAAMTAARLAGDGTPRVENTAVKRRVLWRAQVFGLDAGEARAACTALARKRLPCVTLRPDMGQVASR